MSETTLSDALIEAYRREVKVRAYWLEDGHDAQYQYRRHCRLCGREFFTEIARAARCCDCRLRRTGRKYRTEAPKPQKAAPDAKLSRLQGEILRDLFRGVSQMRKRSYSPYGERVPVRWIRHHGCSAADRAAFSRSLARLEGRGLVIRTNVANGCPPHGHVRQNAEDPPPLRTDHIILTPAGEAIAKRLTKEPGDLSTVSTDDAEQTNNG